MKGFAGQPGGAPDLSQVERVLVIKPSSLGDIVHTLPSVHDLKKSFPHLQITWVANGEWLPLLRGHPDLHATLEFPRQKLRGARRAWHAMQWMRQVPARERPEVALDFQGLLRSGLIAWFSRSSWRVGLTDAREGSRLFHNVRVPALADDHAVDRYRRLAGALGADVSGDAVFHLPAGALPPEEELPSPFLALHPFSRGQGKSLTLAQVQDFCRQCELPVVVLGRVAPAEAARLRLPPRCRNLLNRTTIPELIACLRAASGVISVDSGPMHLAAALKPRQLLAIHTWSDPRKVGPYPGEAHVWKGGTIFRREEAGPGCDRIRGFHDSDVHHLVGWVSERLPG